MPKQYRITTTNVNPVSFEDCVLAATDPVHALKAASIMGGLGASARLAEYNNLTQQEKASKYFQRLADAQAQGIKPGTPAWHAMFSK